MDTHDTNLPVETAQAPDDNIFDDIVHGAEQDVQNVVDEITTAVHHLLQPDMSDTGIQWTMPTLLPALVNPSAVPDIAPATATMIGDPLDDMSFWHLQDGNDTCAIASQQFVIEQLTGQQVTEEQLVAQSEQYGWYTPGAGTPPDDCGNLLQLYGLNVEHHNGATIDDIASQLAQGHGVIVGVDAEKIWGLPETDAATTLLSSTPTIPGQGADHAVEVIGIDRHDPNNPMVVLNDSGTPNGAGELIPLATFLSAWADGGNVMVDAW
jgi:hypothetical protein